MIKLKKIKIKYSFKAFLYLIPLSFGICMVGNILVGFFFNTAENPVSKELAEMVANGQLIKAILIVGVVSPLIEEIVFRFLLYYLVKRFTNYKIAIIATTVAFAIAHGNIEQGLYALFAGFFLGVVRYLYDSVFCAIFTHIMVNLMALFLSGYINVFLPIRERLFILFISFVILVLSSYRIIEIFKEKRKTV